MVSLADLQEPVLCFSKFDTFLEMERRGKPMMFCARPINFAPRRKRGGSATRRRSLAAASQCNFNCE
jgi:hypothetical protein